MFKYIITVIAINVNTQKVKLHVDNSPPNIVYYKCAKDNAHKRVISTMRTAEQITYLKHKKKQKERKKTRMRKTITKDIPITTVKVVVYTIENNMVSDREYNIIGHYAQESKLNKALAAELDSGERIVHIKEVTKCIAMCTMSTAYFLSHAQVNISTKEGAADETEEDNEGN